MTTILTHDGPAGSCQYLGSHSGRSFQLFTIKLSDQDPLMAFMEEEIDPLVDPVLDSLPPQSTLVGIEGPPPEMAPNSIGSRSVPFATRFCHQRMQWRRSSISLFTVC